MKQLRCRVGPTNLWVTKCWNQWGPTAQCLELQDAWCVLQHCRVWDALAMELVLMWNTFPRQTQEHWEWNQRRVHHSG